MTNDEIQSRIEFIIEQQAQLVVNQQRAEERMTRTEDIVVRLYHDTDAKFSALVDAQLRTENKMEALVDAQRRTDDKMNALITLFERHVTENHSG